MSAKFIAPSHFTDPDAAARRLVEIANGTAPSGEGPTLSGFPGGNCPGGSDLAPALETVTPVESLL